jgi:hypothetical protein
MHVLMAAAPETLDDAGIKIEAVAAVGTPPCAKACESRPLRVLQRAEGRASAPQMLFDIGQASETAIDLAMGCLQMEEPRESSRRCR